jgi:hypothetical protein
MDYRNPTYNAFGTIDCEINHPVYGWIPFTADPADIEPIGAEVFNAAKDSAAPYVAPPAPTDDELRAIAQAQRQAAYQAEADPLFFKWQRGTATEAEWLDMIEDIKLRYPYFEE